MIVYLLDMVGYDVRGGGAEPFASLEGAMAKVPDVVWKQTSEDSWEEDKGRDTVSTIWVIEAREVKP